VFRLLAQAQRGRRHAIAHEPLRRVNVSLSVVFLLRVIASLPD
jgi:hypothetical protein